MRKILGLFFAVFTFVFVFSLMKQDVFALPLGGGGGSTEFTFSEICNFNLDDCNYHSDVASWCEPTLTNSDGTLTAKIQKCFPKVKSDYVNCTGSSKVDNIKARIEEVCAMNLTTTSDDSICLGQCLGDTSDMPYGLGHTCETNVQKSSQRRFQRCEKKDGGGTQWVLFELKGRCWGKCYGDDESQYYKVGHICQTNENDAAKRRWIQCKNIVGGSDWSSYSFPSNSSTPTPKTLEYGAEAQCGSCKSGDFVGVDSATVDYCTKNPSACAPLNRKCSKAGFCGSYQAKCAWTDNRPNCMGDGTFCGADSNNCGGKQGMKCCPGLTVQPNGACGCPGSVPTPTPKPPAPVCMSITRDIASPTLGASVRYTCGVSKSATRYEFQYRLLEPNQDVRTARFVPLATVSSSSNISAPLVMNKYGKYTVQCRACNESGCAPFEGGY